MDIWSLHIPVPLALAVVATLGYLFGRRGGGDLGKYAKLSDMELHRAKEIARELEKIALNVRKSIARHHASVVKFKQNLDNLGRQEREVQWNDLCREADEILDPTLKLAAQLSNAYDEIRRQSCNLMTFTEAGAVHLTNEPKPRAVSEAVNAQLAMMVRYQADFSLAVFDIDDFTQYNEKHGHKRGDRVLKELSSVLKDAVRETDIVSRHDGAKFVVIMPQTDLHDASASATV